MIIKDPQLLQQRILEIARRMDGIPRDGVMASVKDILSQVKAEGLQALKDLTLKFDKLSISDFRVKSSPGLPLPKDQEEALRLAIRRVRDFQQKSSPVRMIEKVSPGLEVHLKPIDSVGIYIPAGSAPLFSSVLMTVIPSQIAGVRRIVVTSPPPIDPLISTTLHLLGIDEIYQIGGAQAVAALAYGIPEIGLLPVDKIVGPGNIYVTQAKKEVFGQVGIDALYGPSELMIVADHTADARQVICDLMGQLEHGSGLEAACLLTTSEELAQAVVSGFAPVLAQQPRKAPISQAWSDYGLIGLCESLEDCLRLVNLFAPEHLELKIENADRALKDIHNAGAIFLNGCNEALGDYLAGPSHCLPTGRSARYSSGLSVWDFLKRVNVVDIAVTEELRQATAILARMEGLEAHAKSALA